VIQAVDTIFKNANILKRKKETASVSEKKREKSEKTPLST
jgi:hypothetical protein